MLTKYGTYFLHLNLNCFSIPSFLKHNIQHEVETAKCTSMIHKEGVGLTKYHVDHMCNSHIIEL